jgi:ABC-2 type transport system permease protein
MPRALLGLRGPIGRAISLNLGAAVAWGLGIGLFGLTLGGAAKGFMDQLQESPQFIELLSTVFPNVDYASAGGFLQLLFVEFGVILAGLAAATFVSGWASDENSGRLEIVLASPVERSRWSVAGAIGMFVNVVVFVALTALGIGLGVLSSGDDAATPLVGSLVLGLYAAAVVGIGHAVGGVFGTRFAAPVVVLFVIVTWGVQLLGAILGLPDSLRQLALTAHFGQTMVGVWDPAGIVAAIAIAIGGVAIGVWGFRRRDLVR